MASLAFAYGSFGDILATVQLAIKIAIVLHRSGAPSKECTETEKELKLLGNDLHLALLCLQQTSASPLAPFVAKRIDEEVVQCHKLLARFFGKISAPQASSLWKKIYWAACEGKELAAFRMKLLERRTALTLVVELINSGALRAIQDRIDKVRVGVSGIAHQMLVQHEQLVAVIDHVPHGVAEAMFTVISPTGIAIPISVTYCGSYQVLDGLLKMYMRNRKEAGGDYVERGDYNVVSQGVVIRPPQFTGTLKAGMRLEMSILQRGHQVPAKNCPQCGSPSTPLPDIGWFTCQNSDCESRYQVLESKTSAGLHAHGSGSSRKMGPEKPSEGEDIITLFRLVQVICDNQIHRSRDLAKSGKTKMVFAKPSAPGNLEVANFALDDDSLRCESPGSILHWEIRDNEELQAECLSLAACRDSPIPWEIKDNEELRAECLSLAACRDSPISWEANKSSQLSAVSKGPPFVSRPRGSSF